MSSGILIDTRLIDRHLGQYVVIPQCIPTQISSILAAFSQETRWTHGSLRSASEDGFALVSTNLLVVCLSNEGAFFRCWVR